MRNSYINDKPRGESPRRIHHCYKAGEMECHSHSRRECREQAAEYDDNAADPDRGSRHSSAVDYKKRCQWARSLDEKAQLTDILVVVEEAHSHLEGIVVAAGNHHHHHTGVDLEAGNRTLRVMFYSRVKMRVSRGRSEVQKAKENKDKKVM
jgi:hypothetical protein